MPLSSGGGAPSAAAGAAAAVSAAEAAELLRRRRLASSGEMRSLLLSAAAGGSAVASAAGAVAASDFTAAADASRARFCAILRSRLPTRGAQGEGKRARRPSDAVTLVAKCELVCGCVGRAPADAGADEHASVRQRGLMRAQMRACWGAQVTHRSAIEPWTHPTRARCHSNSQNYTAEDDAAGRAPGRSGRSFSKA